jgi:hypothetical protein
VDGQEHDKNIGKDEDKDRDCDDKNPRRKEQEKDKNIDIYRAREKNNGCSYTCDSMRKKKNTEKNMGFFNTTNHYTVKKGSRVSRLQPGCH